MRSMFVTIRQKKGNKKQKECYCVKIQIHKRFQLLLFKFQVYFGI